MPLSWNEIRTNAIAFARDWKGETRERAEAGTFWNEFFAVFGIKRRTVAAYEFPVKKLGGQYGFIDLFWKGMFLAEHKSAGESLDKAHTQAMDYIQALTREGKQKEIPRYVAVSDFRRIALYDLEEDPETDEPYFGIARGASVEFALEDFHKYVDYFAFIPGYKIHKLAEQNPIDIEAVELLGDFRDLLEAGGYAGHELERLLVRVLFCLFGEDTGLFDRDAFKLYIENHTAEDGSDLGMHLARIFKVLNQETIARQKNLLEELSELPYVNGELFADSLEFADTNRAMRDALLTCCGFDWSRISPAVFGSLFQSVMLPAARRKAGAHYTSERDILKLVNSLFLDDLKAEFEAIKTDRSTRREVRLKDFHFKLSTLKFLDPACGCGNFLVIAYRELRRLEIEVLKATGIKQGVLHAEGLSKLGVGHFYGIEINEFPAQIAQVALWLVEHQMNLELAREFGVSAQSLPLKKSATIRHGNALRIDWNEILPAGECSFLIGNPPFVGAKFQTPEQRAELESVAKGVRNAGLLDYVCAWYFKAVDYTKESKVPIAFVSTNSIGQGEQVGVLWGELFRRGVKIHFAHRTFPWKSEARGAAHVHVIIVGIGLGEAGAKRIYDYDRDASNPAVSIARNISPYFVEGNDTVVTNRSAPLCNVPEIGIGNKPIDDGNYLFTTEERDAFIELEPKSKKWFRRWLGSQEFINGWERWCLWLGECPPNELRAMPEAVKRVAAVKKFRLASVSAGTRKLADTPTRFHVENIPAKNFVVIPKVSSIRRKYIPIGFMSAKTMISDLCFINTSITIYHFGILTSTMHMAWVRQVGGRLKSDYRYSASLVYNNFPWPTTATDAQKATVESKAQAVLASRALFPESSLADLYDPNTMPPALTKAHAELDKAVEKCYRKEPFTSERERVELLFALYEKLANPLTAEAKPKRRRN